MSKSQKKSFLKENLSSKVSAAKTIPPAKGSGFEGMLGNSIQLVDTQPTRKAEKPVENEARVQINLRIKQYDLILLKAISYYKRMTLTDLIQHCYSTYFDSEERSLIENALELYKQDHPELADEIDSTSKNLVG